MAAPLVIDWTQMPTYNTIMSVAVGSALMSLVHFMRALTRDDQVDPAAWALAFAVPGFILTVTGMHMSLTWPLAKYFPFDNIIFGETSFGFGVLLLALTFLLWKRGAGIIAAGDPAGGFARAVRPLSTFIVGMGLALVAIAMAGLLFRLFAAPPEEPISGQFAAYPWVEAIFMSGMFGFVGIGAVLFPLVARSRPARSPAACRRSSASSGGSAGSAFSSSAHSTISRTSG